MSGVTQEKVRGLLAGATPGPYTHDAGKTDYVEAPGYRVVAKVNTHNSASTGDLLAASWHLARAYLAQVEEVGRLRSALEGALAVLDEVARLDEAQAKLSAEYLDLARRARAGEMVRRPTPQVVDYGDVWGAILGLRPVVLAALAPQGGE